jgi:hypothetical protein
VTFDRLGARGASDLEVEREEPRWEELAGRASRMAAHRLGRQRLADAGGLWDCVQV